MRRIGLWLVLVGLVVLGGVVAADIGRDFLVRTERFRPMCHALLVDVEGIDSFRWDNGITYSGASWSQVLTDGVTEADAEERPAIATAVRADRDGFEAFLSAIPTEVWPNAMRLYGLAGDPELAERRSRSAEVEADAMVLHRLGNRECGFA